MENSFDRSEQMQQRTGFYKFTPMRRTSCLLQDAFLRLIVFLCHLCRIVFFATFVRILNTYIREQFREQTKGPSNPILRQI